MTKGLTQGNLLSSKLFSTILENVFRDLYWEQIGLNTNKVQLNHLRFADDLVLVAEDSMTVENMLQQLAEAGKMIGLAIDKSITKK